MVTEVQERFERQIELQKLMANGDDRISCMRCTTVCPKHARTVNKLLFTIAAQKMKKTCSDRK